MKTTREVSKTRRLSAFAAVILTALLLAAPAAWAGTLPAPTLSATPGNGEVELSWTESAGADHYQFRASIDGGASWRHDWKSIGVHGTTVWVVGLTNGTAYTFQVRAGKTSFSFITGSTTYNYGEPSNKVTETPTEE